MLIHLIACGAPPPADTDRPPAEGFALEADDHLALPFVTAGDDAPSDAFPVHAPGSGSKGTPSVTVEGDFTVEGDDGPFAADETRTYTVRYTGSTATPVIAGGRLTLEVDGVALTTTLAAVVGDPDLPDARWTDTGWGEQVTLSLPSAPFPYAGSSYDDDSVFVFVPYGLDDRAGVETVTHLHGWNTVLDEFVPGMRLGEQLAMSGRNAVLIVPQGPVHASDSDFGRLEEPGGYAALVQDVLSLLYRDGFVTRPELASTALAAHSGGYRATASLLDNGDLPVAAVHLFDALYANRDTFRRFAEEGGVLRSVYTAEGGTIDENAVLAEELADAGVPVGDRFDDDALLATSVTIGPSDASHSGCVRDERAWARWLAASGLPHRPTWPPELVSTISDGYATTVTWRGDVGTDGLRYRVEGSSDGLRWSLLTDTTDTTATVSPTPYLRIVVTDIRYGDSDPSDVYGGTGAEWLVVDAFDRALDGSWDYPTHGFGAAIGAALGAPFSVVSNEAVATGEVDLRDYPRVFWMLGDEGTYDRTFSAREMDAVAAFVATGGTFVASGSEIAYATDPAWLDEVLHARLVADDAGTTEVEEWTVGAAYVEDYPDVLAGDVVLWTWSTLGAAAVGFDNRVAVVGFGLENLSAADQAEAFDSLLGWLDP